MFRNSKTRLVAISDGVFAVVLTIMVLNVAVPAQQNLATLTTTMKQILVFLVSFGVVSQYWMLHQELFTALKKVSIKIIIVNFYFLALLALIPFVTAWLSHALLSRMVVLVFATVLVLVDLVQYILFRLVLKETPLQPNAHDLEEVRSVKLMFLISISYLIIGGLFPITLLFLIVIGWFTRTIVSHWFRHFPKR